MALPLHVDSLDDLDEPARTFYVQKESGGYSLDLATKVVSEDKYNREVKRLKDRENWINPEDHNKVLEERDNLKTLTESKKADLDNMVAARIKDKDVETNKTIEDLNNQLNTYKSRYQENLLQSEVAKALSDAGVRASAIPDIQLRAKTIFRVGDEDRVVAMGEDGSELFDKDGVTPLSVKTWIGRMSKDAPHWFEPSTGGSLTGNTSTKVVQQAPKSSVDLYNQGLKQLNRD